MSLIFERNEDKMIPEDFTFFRNLIFSLAGISLSNGKLDLVQSRLRTRIVALGLPTFSAYRSYLEDLSPDHDEFQLFINQLTTNKTEWFREAGHFELLERDFLPRWKQSGKEPLNVWCAASSTGEEAYSLSLLLNEHLKNNYKITASDIDTKVLRLASNGVYPADILTQIPSKYHHHFARGTKEISDWVKVRKEIKTPVTFQQINLNKNFHFEKKFNLVLCRNVLIYFNQETISNLMNRIAHVTTDDAVLYIGHSESLQNTETPWVLSGPSVYTKRRR